MTKELTVSDQEKFNYLAEEIKSILVHFQEKTTIAMIAAKYMVGETIATHQLYKKHSRGQSELYNEVSKRTSVRTETLSDCVKFYETYPNKKPRQIADELYTKHGAWRNIRMVLYGENPDAVRKDRKEVVCSHCQLVVAMVKRIRRFDQKEKGVDYFAGWDQALDVVLSDLKEIHSLKNGNS